MSFILDPILEKDSFWIADLALSQLRLMNDARYPWMILVPRVPSMKEIIDLREAQQAILLQEIRSISHLSQKLFQPDKLNIAALGNVVQQLHIHIVARYKDDLAWPKPVWGIGSPMPYTQEQRIAQAKKIMNELNAFVFDRNAQ